MYVAFFTASILTSVCLDPVIRRSRCNPFRTHQQQEVWQEHVGNRIPSTQQVCKVFPRRRRRRRLIEALEIAIVKFVDPASLAMVMVKWGKRYACVTLREDLSCIWFSGPTVVVATCTFVDVITEYRPILSNRCEFMRTPFLFVM
jgi:hypothetical protein